MAARCSICLKTVINKKQPIRLITNDAECKIKFGYYSLHNEELNRTLVNTRVHRKCYKKYHDRWYNECIRKNKKNNIEYSYETQRMLVIDSNTT